MRGGPVLCIVVAAGLGLWLYNRSSGGSSLDYTDDWAKAKETAKAEKKPILLNFGGPW